MIVSVFSAFMCTIGFSIMFNVERKHLLICGVVGGIGWMIYLIGQNVGFSDVLATFIASLVITQTSYFLARKRKTPITVYLIPGIISLVPGLGLYRAMYAMIEGNFSRSVQYAVLTFELAGVIAGAIVIISLVPFIWRKPKRHKKRTNI